MIDTSKSFVVFECCRLVKGYNIALFCDIQRNTFRLLPLEFADLILNFNRKQVSEIFLYYKHENHSVIQENLLFLEAEEFIFFTYNPEWFPEMSLEWDEPSVLTNGIIDINFRNFDQVLSENIWQQLSELGCEHLQLRVFDSLELHKLEEKLNLIKAKRIISLEIILKYNSEISDEMFNDFVNRQPRIYNLILHSAPINEVTYLSQTNMGNIYKNSTVLTSEVHCGNISEDRFILNIKSFTESIHHNSCLNRKISIDVEGNIKNCPSMTESFGNIRDTTLAEAIEKPGFKKYWDINKDKIHVCKDCEFRYICTDCRAYVEDPEDILSKPLKCGYNPYTGEWSEWSTNPLKQKAIDFYGMREMVDDMNKAVTGNTE